MLADTSNASGGTWYTLIAPVAGLVGVVIGSLIVLHGQKQNRLEARLDRLLEAYNGWLAALARLNHLRYAMLGLWSMQIDAREDSWIKQNNILELQQTIRDVIAAKQDEDVAFARLVLLDCGSAEANEANKVRALSPWDRVREQFGDSPSPDQATAAQGVHDSATQAQSIAVGKLAARISVRLGTRGYERR